MPIKGLTDRGASFPRIGELRKGGEKPAGNKPGPDLKHFRFTSQHPEVLESFTSRYGTHPTAVNVYLPFATAAENFEAWIEEWGAGSLKWRGDGETLVVWQKPDGTYSREPKPQPAGGKQSGRLKIIIPELGRLAYVTALTTAVNDIMEMQSTLDAYEALRGDLRGIPFILSRVPRMVSTPKVFPKGHPQQYQPTGERVRMEKWLWHLEAQPVWVQAQLSVMQRAALPAVVEGQYQLSAGAVDVQTGEIVDDDEDDDTDVITNEKQKASAHEPAQTQQTQKPPAPAVDDHPGDIDTIRNDLARYTRMTGVQVADAAVSTGLYTSKEHAANSLAKHEGFMKSGGKLSAGIDANVGLDWFDWLMARKDE